MDRDFKLNKGCYSMFMNVKMQYSKKITPSKLTYRFITISEKLWTFIVQIDNIVLKSVHKWNGSKVAE